MKQIKIFALLLAAASMTACNQPAEPTLSQQMVEAHGLGDFYCNRHYQADLGTTGWDYVSGLVANAVLKTSREWAVRPM